MVEIKEVLFLVGLVLEKEACECLMGGSEMIAKGKKDLGGQLRNIMGNLVVMEADCDER
jgi:hypothetical protein